MIGLDREHDGIFECATQRLGIDVLDRRGHGAHVIESEVRRKRRGEAFFDARRRIIESALLDKILALGSRHTLRDEAADNPEHGWSEQVTATDDSEGRWLPMDSRNLGNGLELSHVLRFETNC
ncbi:MAG: hypothetical protein DME02_04185 [Candidatus Rokuibacteriota bacterium]|nr:MAG: hypothetical protein DME02_04185 [Candidatus Rokubacteria bacterium]